MEPDGDIMKEPSAPSKMETVAFDVMYYMLEGNVTMKNKWVVPFLILVDAAQIISLSLLEEYGWGKGVVGIGYFFLHPVQVVFGLENSTDNGVQFYVFWSIFFAFLINAVVVHFVIRDGQVKHINTIRTIRFLATVVTLLYISFLLTLVEPLTCFTTDIPCPTSGEPLFRLILAVPFSILFIGVAVILVLLFYDDDLRQRRMMSKSHGRVDFAYLVAKTVLVCSRVFFKEAVYFRLLLLILFMFMIFAIQLVLSPSYHDRINHAKAGSILSAAGTAVAAVISLNDQVTTAGSVVGLILLIIGFAAIGVVSSIYVARGRQRTTMMLIENMEGLSEAEVKERLSFPTPYHVDIIIRSLLREGRSIHKNRARRQWRGVGGMLRGATLLAAPILPKEDEAIPPLGSPPPGSPLPGSPPSGRMFSNKVAPSESSEPMSRSFSHASRDTTAFARSLGDIPLEDQESHHRGSLVMAVLGAAVGQFPNSTLVRIHAARTLLAMSERKALQARTQLLLAQRLTKKSGMDIRYRVFFMLSKVRQTRFGAAFLGGQTNMDVVGFAEFRRQFKQTTGYARRARRAMAKFWDLVAEMVKSGSGDVRSKLSDAAARVDQAERKARTAYDTLLSNHPRSRRLLRDYGQFLAEVARDMPASRACLQLADAIDARRTRKSRMSVSKPRGFRITDEGSDHTPSVLEDSSNEATIALLQRKVQQMVLASSRSKSSSRALRLLHRRVMFGIFLILLVWVGAFGLLKITFNVYGVLTVNLHRAGLRAYDITHSLWSARTVAWCAERGNMTSEWQTASDMLLDQCVRIGEMHSILYESDTTTFILDMKGKPEWTAQNYEGLGPGGALQKMSMLDVVWNYVRAGTDLAESPPLAGGFTSTLVESWHRMRNNGPYVIQDVMKRATDWYGSEVLENFASTKQIIIVIEVALVIFFGFAGLAMAVPIWLRIGQERRYAISLFNLVPLDAIESLRTLFRSSKFTKSTMIDRVSEDGSAQLPSSLHSSEKSGSTSGDSDFDEMLYSGESDIDMDGVRNRGSLLSQVTGSYAFRSLAFVVLITLSYYLMLGLVVVADMPLMHELSGGIERIRLTGSCAYLSRETAFSRGFGATLAYPATANSMVMMSEPDAITLLHAELDALQALQIAMRSGDGIYPGVIPGTEQAKITLGDTDDPSRVSIDSVLADFVRVCSDCETLSSASQVNATVDQLENVTGVLMNLLMQSVNETNRENMKDEFTRERIATIYLSSIPLISLAQYYYFWMVRLRRELGQRHARTRRMLEMIPEEVLCDIEEVRQYLANDTAKITEGMVKQMENIEMRKVKKESVKKQATLFLDPQGAILDFGEPAFLDQTMIELKGRPFIMLGGEEDLRDELALMLESKEKESRLVTDHLVGVSEPVHIRLVRVRNADDMGYCVTLSKTSEKKKEEKQGDTSVLDDVVAQLPVLHVKKDCIVFVSEEASRLLGKRVDKLMTQPVRNILDIGELNSAPKNKWFRVKRSALSLDGYLYEKDGYVVIVLRTGVNASPFRDVLMMDSFEDIQESDIPDDMGSP